MPLITGGVQLKYGAATQIARKMGLSAEHVIKVAKGLREGSAPLIKEIRASARRYAKSVARKADQISSDRMAA